MISDILASTIRPDSLIQFVLMVSAIGSFVVLFGFGIHILLNKFVSAKWLYLFWILVVCRFVMFAAPESPTSFLNFVSHPEVSQRSFTTTEPLVSDDIELTELQNDLIFESTPVQLTVSSQARSKLPVWQIAFWIWFTGVGYALVKLSTGAFRVRRLVENSMPPEEALHSMFDDCKGMMGLSSAVKLLISQELQIPAMAGAFKPVVLVPKWCEEKLTPVQLKMVITHELIHIQRRDGLIQLLAFMISAIHWFNPIVHSAIRFVESMRELSCDQKVISIFNRQAISPEATSQIQSQYGETILEIATRAISKKPVCPVFLGGFVNANKCLIKQRIAMLVQQKSRKRFGALITAIVATMMIAVGFTSAQNAQPSNETLQESPSRVEQEYVPQGSTPVPFAIGGRLQASPTIPGIQALPLVADLELAQLKGGKRFPLPAQINLDVGEQMNLESSDRAPFVSVEDPEIASLEFISKKKIVLEGIRSGQTTIDVANKNGKPTRFVVNVTRPVIRLQLKEAKRVKLPFRIPEMVVENPEVANVSPVSPSEILVTGLKFGSSPVILFDEEKKKETLEIEVIPNIEKIELEIRKKFPESKINVDATGGVVILKGYCDSKQHVEICDWARTNFLSDGVVSEVAVGDPIAIKVCVYHVSKKKLVNLGVDWKAMGLDQKVVTIKDVVKALAKPKAAVGESMATGVLQGDHFKAFLGGLERNAIAKLIDQPVLVAYPGKLAELLSGGEVPIETIDKDGKKKIEFRSYGTKISLRPKLDENENLTLEVRAEYSKLFPPLAEGGPPRFSVRRINTGQQMQFGDSMALVGDFSSKGLGEDPDKEVVFLISPRKIKKVAVATGEGSVQQRLR